MNLRRRKSSIKWNGLPRMGHAEANKPIKKFKDSHGTSYVQMVSGRICRSDAMKISETVTVSGIKMRRGRPVFGGFSKKLRRVLRRAMARNPQ